MSYSNGPTIVTNGLVLALDAGDRNSYTSGSSTWFDLARTNNGTLTNGPTFDTGSGGSIVFDGVDDVVETNQPLSSGVPTSFTYNIWLKRNGNGFNYPRLFLNTRVNISITITEFGNPSDGRILFRLTSNSGDTDIITNTLLQNNIWTNLTFVWTGTNMKIYQNSTDLNYNVSFLGPLQPVISGLYPCIGGETTAHEGSKTSSFNGNIGIAQFYNRALSATEILQNYNATKGRFGLT